MLKKSFIYLLAFAVLSACGNDAEKAKELEEREKAIAEREAALGIVHEETPTSEEQAENKKSTQEEEKVNKKASSSSTDEQKPQSSSGEREKDPAVAGNWIKSTQINSGSGDNFASFSSEKAFRISGNGTFEYGASRSIGGGMGMSYGSDQWSEPQLRGNWYTRDGKFYVSKANGQDIPEAQQLMGTYKIVGNNLVTVSTSGEREVWQR